MSTNTSRAVFIGRRLHIGRRLAWWYRQINDDDTTGPAIGAFQPYQAGLAIGAIISIAHLDDDPTKILIDGPNAPRIIGAWHNPDDIAQWKILDRADAQAAATAARATTELQGLPDAFTDAIDTLRTHLTPLTHTQRAALLPLIQARILDPR